MKADLLLESSLKQLKLPCFAQSYQTLAQEAARTNLSYERYLLALAKAGDCEQGCPSNRACDQPGTLSSAQRTGRF